MRRWSVERTRQPIQEEVAWTEVSPKQAVTLIANSFLIGSYIHALYIDIQARYPFAV